MILVGLSHCCLWTSHSGHRKCIKITLNITTDLLVYNYRDIFSETCENYFIILMHTSYTTLTEAPNGTDSCTPLPHQHIACCYKNSVVHWNKIVFLFNSIFILHFQHKTQRNHYKITQKSESSISVIVLWEHIVYTYGFYHWPNCHTTCYCTELFSCNWLP